ncbi:MAG: helix-turn-helix domain-containing protein [Lachnospiraceae bacterium]|nr:helix-turn-helix domain-containing protein [Lachnospiraceae bacterium]
MEPKGKQQGSRIEMDYIYMKDGQRILIESAQREAKQEVISQYVQCRKDKKITQDELAKRSGMARTNITRFESGKYNPTLEMMVKIASALDMEVSIKLQEREDKQYMNH